MTLTVGDILAPGGLIAGELGGYEHRGEQMAMAEAVAAAFDAREHLLVEAGTGVGKSFAYLVPAILQAVGENRRVIISTYTIALQEQLIGKDLPFLERVLPMKFFAVLGKGRGNYLCLRRLALAARGRSKLLSGEDEFGELDALVEWAMDTRTGSRQDIDFPVSPAVWSKVRAESGLCPGPKCPYYDTCFFHAARRRMQAANILVVNHALFFSDLALRARSRQLLGAYDLAVLDEAHTVEAVAGDHFGRSVSAAAVRFLLRDLHNDRTNRGMLVATGGDKSAIDAVNRAANAGEAFFDALANYRGAGIASSGRIREAGIVDNPLSPALKEVAAALGELRTRAKGEQAWDLLGMEQRAVEQADTVEKLIDQQEDGHAYWVSTRRSRGKPIVSLASAPIDVAPIVRELVFDEIKSVVLTSATLATARGNRHGFDYIRRRLGMEEGRELLLSSPFDFRRQARLYVETRLGDANDLARFVPAAAEAIQYYLTKSDGRCFVLFTSYAMLGQVAEAVEEFCATNDFPLLVQKQSASRGRMLRQFQDHGRAVLMGTASFWQGVDVVGEALSNVIITKLPFAVPDSPVIEARIEAIRDGGGNAFMEYQLPEAVIRFKQGFGRLIRSQSDRGFVVVLDHRIVTRPYGRTFVQALPEIDVVRDEFCHQRT